MAKRFVTIEKRGGVQCGPWWCWWARHCWHEVTRLPSLRLRCCRCGETKRIDEEHGQYLGCKEEKERA